VIGTFRVSSLVVRSAASCHVQVLAVCLFSLFVGPADAQDGAPERQLDALIETVVARNPSILAASADARAAGDDLDTARWQRFPSPSVQYEGGDGRPVGTMALTQPLWMVSGSIPAQIEGAEASAFAKRMRTQEVRYQAAERTVDAWRGAASALAKKDVDARVLSQLLRFQALMQRRVDAQVSPPVELELVSARVHQARVDVINAQSIARQFLSRLEQLAGEPVTAEMIAPSESLPARASAALADLGLGASHPDFVQWANQHPAVQRAEQELRAADAQIKVKRAERWPQLYLKLQRVTSDASGARRGTSAFVGLQYTPGAGFSSVSQARAAIARSESAAAAIEAQRRDMLGAFESDWSELQGARERQDMLTASIGGSRAVLESYERLFVAGRRSWLDVLTAARELQQSEEALADTRVALIAAVQRIQLRSGRKPWQREGNP
jgi:adhesin transport system outer membrane protein